MSPQEVFTFVFVLRSNNNVNMQHCQGMQRAPWYDYFRKVSLLITLHVSKMYCLLTLQLTL
jgi:hypothetical protein